MGIKTYGIAGKRAIAKIPDRDVNANRAITPRRSFLRLMKPASGFAVMNAAVKLARSRAASALLMPRSIYNGRSPGDQTEEQEVVQREIERRQPSHWTGKRQRAKLVNSWLVIPNILLLPFGPRNDHPGGDGEQARY